MSDLIAGAMLGKTVTGHTSCDGGSAIISSEAVHFCLPEERTSGIKYAPGFGTSLEAGLHYLSLKPNDLQALVLCSYGESVPTDLSYAAAQLPKSMAALSDRLRFAPEHHHLHALLAFRLSGFTEALVLVADNEGMVIGSRHPSVDLKGHPAERTSVYIGSPGAVTLLARPQWAPWQASLGEAYRKFSYFCGFPSHQLAGKTMALAAYGDPERFREVRLFEVNAGGDTICFLPNDIGDPILEVQEFFRQHCGPVKRPTSPDEQAARDAAAFVQLELERAVLGIVKAFLSKTRLRHVCIAGGIAYNCRLIGRLAREIEAEFFVPPSPGDQGLALGAALWYREVVLGLSQHEPPDPYLGLPARIPAELLRSGMEGPPKSAQLVQLLDSGTLMGLWEGRSEYGRRALGHRSIICSTERREAIVELQTRKKREWFRPFGVSVLASHINDLFDGPPPDAFMLRTANLTALGRATFTNVVHADGTVRPQVVPENASGILPRILRALRDQGRVPTVVNTSFNRAGEPIVETWEKARNSLRVLVDVLVTSSTPVVTAEAEGPP